MEQLWITLPPLAPDYSGVCSAMFDLGGITVIHDAGGCTGTYAGYDEPRWYGSTSKVFCSGLRDIDAVLGRDDKLIENIIKAGELLNPTMYTVTGSPVPMVVGADMTGIACEIEAQTGLPAFGFDTNGLGLYNKGVSEAMCSLVKRFTSKQEETISRGINILGTTPIDFSANSNADDLAEMLKSWGFTVIGHMMMGADIGQIEDLAKAEVNIVVTESGLAAAELLYNRFKIPYVVGMPIGNDETVREALEATLKDKEIRILNDDVTSKDILIVGEQVISNGIRRAILKKSPDRGVTVGTLFGLNKKIAANGDLNISCEETLIDLIYSGEYKVLIGDPLIEGLLSDDCGVRFVKLPHVAISSKLHWNNAPEFFSEEFEKIIEQI